MRSNRAGGISSASQRGRQLTVLTIFRRMKEKQVGEILPLLSRERAIALTQALAERSQAVASARGFCRTDALRTQDQALA